mmetsp:Transcript_100156/g.180729  ORF Transcript_100156/g.180729 Transcript_100156/m.180729 type:complete len:94 (-) Transcript_100156:4-285(-)
MRTQLMTRSPDFAAVAGAGLPRTDPHRMPICWLFNQNVVDIRGGNYDAQYGPGARMLTLRTASEGKGMLTSKHAQIQIRKKSTTHRMQTKGPH